MKQTLAFLYMLSSLFCAAQAPLVTLTGENYITLDGGGFRDQKITFTKANGDWFSLPQDAHSTLILETTFDNRTFRMDVEWDGKKDAYVITDDIRHQERKGEFLINLPDKSTYGDGINASPMSEQEVNITVKEINDLNLTASFSGKVTNGGKEITINGVISLHRKQVNRTKTFTYKNYDNTVYEKLFQAEARSPSESELNFDHDVKQAIHDALEPVTKQFEANQWIAENETELIPLIGAARGSEKAGMQILYDFGLRLSQQSETAISYRNQLEAAGNQVQASADQKAAVARLMELGRKINGATHVQIGVQVNNNVCGFSTFKAGTKVTRLPNGALYIQAFHAQALTGGNDDASADAGFILMGNWKQPSIQKQEDGGEHVSSTTAINTASHRLQAQSIILRIEANEELVKEIIGLLDFSKLKSLFN